MDETHLPDPLDTDHVPDAPFKYPVRFEGLESARGHGPVLLASDHELICEAVYITLEEASHVAERLNMAEAAVYKMRLMGWHDIEGGRVGNLRLDQSFDDWTSALDWCVGEACE